MNYKVTVRCLHHTYAGQATDPTATSGANKRAAGKSWRRRRDSNSRTACTVGGFQNRCHRPLGHSSGGGTTTTAAIASIALLATNTPRAGCIHKSIGGRSAGLAGCGASGPDGDPDGDGAADGAPGGSANAGGGENNEAISSGVNCTEYLAVVSAAIFWLSSGTIAAVSA
jgi:hypothetical protein